MTKAYDSSWNEGDEEKWERKCRAWQRRDWETWLSEHLVFPFEVEREEDDDEALFTDVADREPFRLGHFMTVLGVEDDDPDYGVMVKVQEGSETGYVPLADVTVTSKADPNFWPVREYVVWYANR